MVELARKFIAAAVFVLFSVVWIPAQGVVDFRIGDRLQADVITPVPLLVIDPEATAELKAREGERVPAVFRFYPEVAKEVTEGFHESFIQTRANFLDVVEENFDTRKLDEAALTSAKFSQLVLAFQKQNQLFPVGTNLARLWAVGGSDREFEAPWLVGLSEQMQLFILPTNSLPEGAKIGGTIRLVTYADTGRLTVPLVVLYGTNHPKSEFISYPRAKLDLVSAFQSGQGATARYLSSFIKPNCIAESELTIAMRQKQTDGLVVTESFGPGEIIARKGEAIDQKIFAALIALKEQTGVVAATSTPPTSASLRNYWLFAVIAGIVFLAVVSIFMWRRGQAKLASRLSASTGLVAGADGWQQRALAAEQRAEKAQTVIREGLIGHLARWMSDTLVQKLLMQRAHLIETQQEAVNEVDRLGQRLDSIHMRMQDRLLAYERRIVELEKELETKDEINRELIQAEIQKIRRQIDVERVKSEGGLN